MSAHSTGLERLAGMEAMLARWEAQADQLARDLAAYTAAIDVAIGGGK